MYYIQFVGLTVHVPFTQYAVSNYQNKIGIHVRTRPNGAVLIVTRHLIAFVLMADIRSRCSLTDNELIQYSWETITTTSQFQLPAYTLQTNGRQPKTPHNMISFGLCILTSHLIPPTAGYIYLRFGTVVQHLQPCLTNYTF